MMKLSRLFFWGMTLLLLGGLSMGCADDGDDGGGERLTFENGEEAVEAATKVEEEKVETTITHNGVEVLELTVETDKVSFTFPNFTPPDDIDEGMKEYFDGVIVEEGNSVTITLRSPLEELPGEFAANRLAVFIAGMAIYANETEETEGFREDNPGCDWFPDTRCTLHCCYDHDVCYAEHSCGASSWLPFVGSEVCKNCNAVAQQCILEACAYGLEGDPSKDECYDAACREHYTCPNEEDDCVCEHDCDPPSGCGNGTCEVDEDAENCASDCLFGSGENMCCRESNNCPSETPTDCPGSCCCCGMGEVCGEGYVCTFVGY